MKYVTAAPSRSTIMMLRVTSGVDQSNIAKTPCAAAARGLVGELTGATQLTSEALAY
jgi:hypothetical protein